MNNIKSIRKDIINEIDSGLIKLFDISKHEQPINSKVLNFSIDFILKTEMLSGQLF